MTREAYWIEAPGEVSARELVDVLMRRGVRGVAFTARGRWYVRVVGHNQAAVARRPAYRVNRTPRPEGAAAPRGGPRRARSSPPQSAA